MKFTHKKSTHTEFTHDTSETPLGRAALARAENIRGSQAGAAIHFTLMKTDAEPAITSSMGRDHSPAMDSRSSAELPGRRR
jgi:hypothetical protein